MLFKVKTFFNCINTSIDIKQTPYDLSCEKKHHDKVLLSWKIDESDQADVVKYQLAINEYPKFLETQLNQILIESNYIYLSNLLDFYLIDGHQVQRIPFASTWCLTILKNTKQFFYTKKF